MKQFMLMLALIVGLGLASQSVTLAQEDGEEAAPEQPTEGGSDEGGE